MCTEGTGISQVEALHSTPAFLRTTTSGGSAQPVILLVEDEDFVREVVTEVLRSSGFVVLSAKNAAEALLLFDQRAETAELLLTDIVLRGDDGRTLAGKLKQRNTRLKVLFMTGYAEQIAELTEKHELCLAKPFSTPELMRRVALLLDGERVRLAYAGA